MQSPAILDRRLADLAGMFGAPVAQVEAFVLLIGARVVERGMTLDAAIADASACIREFTAGLLDASCAEPGTRAASRWSEFQAAMAADFHDAMNGVSA